MSKIALFTQEELRQAQEAIKERVIQSNRPIDPPNIPVRRHDVYERIRKQEYPQKLPDVRILFRHVSALYRNQNSF